MNSPGLQAGDKDLKHLLLPSFLLAALQAASKKGECVCLLIPPGSSLGGYSSYAMF